MGQWIYASELWTVSSITIDKMHSREFTTKLRSAHRDSGLTKAEMARWFGRNYWTVIRWLKGSAPQQNRKSAEQRLLLLLAAIEAKYLPLEDSLAQQARERALGKALDAVNDRNVVTASLERTP